MRGIVVVVDRATVVVVDVGEVTADAPEVDEVTGAGVGVAGAAKYNAGVVAAKGTSTVDRG